MDRKSLILQEGRWREQSMMRNNCIGKPVQLTHTYMYLRIKRQG